MTPEKIRQFVLATNRFAGRFKAVREHLCYCVRCQQLFIEIATEHKLNTDVNLAIVPNFAPSQGALDFFANCRCAQPVLKTLQKHSYGG